MNITTWNFSKRRNSTKQPTGAGSDVTCVLKTPTSVIRPTFRLSGFDTSHNYVQWGTRYYFVDDIEYETNDVINVTCVLDALATYKANIQASTQYVCYSSHNTSPFLIDTRIPVKTSETVDHVQVATGQGLPVNTTGFYALTATGQTGTKIYALDKSDIEALIDQVGTWSDDLINDIINGTLLPNPYDFTTPEKAIESLSYISTQYGVLGNAYANAPQNIRSCLWLPLLKSYFTSGNTRLMLGNFDTLIDAPEVNITPYANTIDINIPWQHNDFRRSTCESLLLYLPFAGCVNIPTDMIVNETELHVRYSISPSDGVIAYFVYAGGFNIIGTYGGSLGGNYAIGINQQASIGEILQTSYSGMQKTVNAAIQTSISPMSMIAGGIGATLESIAASYETRNVAMSTHSTTIGSFGGCAAAQLTLGVVILVSVAHDTAVAPSSMASTMGLPTMAPMSLSSLTGYCQCANAHVELAAEASEIDAVDTMLNQGFYIE